MTEPTRLDEIQTELTALAEKRETDDITVGAYEAQRAALSAEATKISAAEGTKAAQAEERKRQEAEAEEQQKAAQERATAEWHKALDSFFKDDANEKFRPTEDGNAYYDALAAQVQRMNATGKTYLEVLDEAKKRAAKGLGLDEEKPPPKPRKGNERIPNTLGDAPVSEANTETDSKYDEIDKLIGLDKEAALAKLSKAEEAAYLRGE